MKSMLLFLLLFSCIHSLSAQTISDSDIDVLSAELSKQAIARNAMKLAVLDFTESNSITDFSLAVSEELRIHLAVNNAALTNRAKIGETDAAMFDRIIAVNARAPMLLIRALLPELKKNRGVVLNIGSVLAHCGQANLLAYSMSKGALMTMTRNLADALGTDRVRVNQLNVGWTLTENEYQVKLGDGLGEGWPDRLPAYAVPMGRLLMPEDIAVAAVYWVGRESFPVTGTVAELEQYPLIGRYTNHEGDPLKQQDHTN
jgi:NAD(P)-dependent dehydrogenase (short-subunit alcohol dehydrogenase family)